MLTVVDDDPDLSHLGQYVRHDQPGAIDRARRGKLSPMQLRYWVPAIPEYADQDYARAESYNAGDWWMIRVAATVTILIPVGDVQVIHTVTTPGLYGVESDSGDDYIASVYADECDVLVAMLEGLGITVEGVANAV